MPSNQIELWAALESDRLMHPVMREFYKERNVVMEERRMRTDSRPTGRLVEQFLGTAFMANPYHRPTIGYASDLQSFSATDAAEFFQRYYVPSNMVIGLVGDLDPAQGLPHRREVFRPASHRAQAGRSCTPTSRRRIRCARSRCTIPRSRSTLRAITGPAISRRMTRCTTPSPTSCPTGAPRACTARWCATRRLPPYAAGFTGFPGIKYGHLFAFYARAAARPHQRRDAEGHPRGDRQAEDAGRDRRRVADVQDAHQGRPDSRPGQQRRPGASSSRPTRRATATGANCSAISTAWTR